MQLSGLLIRVQDKAAQRADSGISGGPAQAQGARSALSGLLIHAQGKAAQRAALGSPGGRTRSQGAGADLTACSSMPGARQRSG